MGKKLEKIYGIGKTHLIESTAMLAATNPIFATLENVVWGMPDETSLNARLFAAGITYAGLGSVFSKGRDLSQKLFKIEDSKEVTQFLHDTSYIMALSAVLAPIIYTAAGASPEEVLKGTSTAIAVSPLTGYVAGYALDGIRDLTGIKKSTRIPKKITGLPSKVKKCLAGLLIAGLVTTHYGIYKATPDETTNTGEHIMENSLSLSNQ